MKAISDKDGLCGNGYATVGFLAAAALLAFWFLQPPNSAPGVAFMVVAAALIATAASGFTIVEPNSAKVLTFLGPYAGTIRDSGFQFTVPLTRMTTIPLKLTNFVTSDLKVNDRNGNPIEIGAVVVWRVRDAAQATFNVDNYRDFVGNQADIAIRTLAAHYPYDSETEPSLRGNVDEVAQKLQLMLQDKLMLAGIHVEEARLSHLAYAPEIASAMLKRQQAVAIFQARRYMVENALAIIDEVVGHFDKKSPINISDDKKADLINSLLVVMTGEKESQPVLSVGG
ncbi:MAG: SPFH domain-containing protein [Alphaproteobacteria bacterium]|nr:SPFH domain-containing protein [Alphaproteobacteria bacterium]